MTKKQALQDFKENVLPFIQATYEKDGVVDKPARCEAWNDYTDALCKEGKITKHQNDTWLNPY